MYFFFLRTFFLCGQILFMWDSMYKLLCLNVQFIYGKKSTNLKQTHKKRVHLFFFFGCFFFSNEDYNLRLSYFSEKEQHLLFSMLRIIWSLGSQQFVCMGWRPGIYCSHKCFIIHIGQVWVML